MFECGLRSSDLTIVLRRCHSSTFPRRIFKTTCQHIVEQYRSHIGLRERLRRGTVDLVRLLSLATVPSSERRPPEGDVEKLPRSRSMGSIRPYTKPLITRVDTILKPIDPSGRPSWAVKPVVPTQPIESPTRAPVPLSPVASISSEGHQAGPSGEYQEATPGDRREVQVLSPLDPLSTISTTSPQGLRSPLPVDGTPEPSVHTSANASSVDVRRTETLRQRKTLPIPLTKTTFSERPPS